VVSSSVQIDVTAPHSPLPVMMVATSYPSSASDWRGRFIREVACGIARRDDVSLTLWAPPGEAEPEVKNGLLGSDGAWLRRLMQRGGIAHQLRSHSFTAIPSSLGLLFRLRRRYARGEIALHHINWLQNLLPMPRGDGPVLVTALGTDMKLLQLPGVRRLLRHAMRGRAVAICPNADWMVPELERSFGEVAMIRPVSFGIDPSWYALVRTFESSHVPKWLCVSRLTADKIGPLFDWTAPMFANGCAELHLLGPMQEEMTLPAWVHWHGPASPDELRSKWFPSAHGLISLSQHSEGRPQVMLEALASGLPVVASRLPAHNDLLGDCEAGMLCADQTEVMAALQALADPVLNRTLGMQGRARMQADVGTWDDCAARYVDVYRELTGPCT
jgi:glycosyltransferase involved in cell wall biosynthesis